MCECAKMEKEYLGFEVMAALPAGGNNKELFSD